QPARGGSQHLANCRPAVMMVFSQCVHRRALKYDRTSQISEDGLKARGRVSQQVTEQVVGHERKTDPVIRLAWNSPKSGSDMRALELSAVSRTPATNKSAIASAAHYCTHRSRC